MLPPWYICHNQCSAATQPQHSVVWDRQWSVTGQTTTKSDLSSDTKIYISLAGDRCFLHKMSSIRSSMGINYEARMHMYLYMQPRPGFTVHLCTTEVTTPRNAVLLAVSELHYLYDLQLHTLCLLSCNQGRSPVHINDPPGMRRQVCWVTPKIPPDT